MRFLLTTLLLAVHLCCSAQLWHCKANSFRPQLEGIPIRQIFHDSEGFVWYATENSGLIRDDGYSLLHFYPNNTDESVGFNTVIDCLAEDDKSNIWIGTDKGLFVLDKRDYSITLVEQTINLAVTSIFRRANGDFAVALPDRLLFFGQDRELKQTYALPRDINDSWVSSMTEDNYFQLVVVMANGGVYLLDEPSRLLVNMNWPYTSTPYHVASDIPTKSLWISTWGMGVVRYTTDYVRMFDTTYDEPDSDSSKNKVVDVVIDNSRRLFWIVASDSLSVYKDEGESMTPIAFPKPLPRNMKDVSCASLDVDKNLWIATLQKGLFVLDVDEFIGKNKVGNDSSLNEKPRATMVSVDGDTILSLKSKVIELDANINKVCIHVSLMDMLNASKIRFAYSLSTSDDWVELGKGKNVIVLENLPDETIKLYVRYSLSNGEWSESTLCLTIIKGGFASSSGGWLLMVIFMVILAATVWYYRKHKSSMKSTNAVVKPLEAHEMHKHRIHRDKPVLITPDPVKPLPKVEPLKPEPKKETVRITSFSKKEDKEFADKIERFIKNHLSNADYGVEELAADMNMSRMHLYRRTQSLFGLTPLELMRDRRMERAVHLLTTTNLIVADIASLTGFSTVRGFNRSFKTQFNLSPSEYRNRPLSDSSLNGRE